MAYSQFATLQSVKQKLQVGVKVSKLFDNVPALPPSTWLTETLKRYTTKKMAYFNEKSRSEGIVFPILSDLQNYHNHQFALYSGALLDAEKELGLNGECDFILSRSEQSTELECPIVCVVEAKDNDIELGIPQCIAQLYGARLYSQKNEHFNSSVLYGAVTTGSEWNFLQIIENKVIVDEELYSIKNLPELLGILNYIIHTTLI